MILDISKAKLKQNRKALIGVILIAALSALALIISSAGDWKISLALVLSSIVLLSVYIALSFELVHRAVIALFGAAIIIIIVVTTGVLTPADSFEFATNSIDFNTIGLLLGMMIIVAILAETGIFQYIGIKLSKISKGRLYLLLVLLGTFTAVSSMFIDNVTSVLLMVPVTISVFRILNVSPIPFILAQVLTSNVGGAATLIGDPPNILIGSAANIDFNSFIIHLGPAVAISFAASLILLRLLFRKELKVKPQHLDELMSRHEDVFIAEKKGLMKKSLAVLFAVIVLFVILGGIHVEPSLVALGGAGMLMLITRASPERVFHEVDWTTLIFFAGIFIIIGGAEESGMIDILSKGALGITGGEPWTTFFVVIWLSAIASAFVDNVPFAATMIPVISTLTQNESISAAFGGFAINPLWWALALGAGLGGNGTLIGSSAGIIAVGLAEKQGYTITFNRFFKVGFPFMIFTTTIASIVLAIGILVSM
ncbi:MAG: ArsB/NhaD family transporter [Thermoproteota archaeon]|nr:ArsB/NhaD family transporter [Thermoproteota archaeon]